MLVNDFRYTLYGLYACILHELGHLLFMHAFRMEVNRVIFYGAGIKIKLNKGRFYPILHELVMLSGGCFVNLLTFVLFAISAENTELQIFGIINLSIGLFNLFPLRHFDGGKILHLLIDKFSAPKATAENHNLLQIAGMIFIFTFMALLMYFRISNFTLFFTLLYFIIADTFLQNS